MKGDEDHWEGDKSCGCRKLPGGLSEQHAIQRNEDGGREADRENDRGEPFGVRFVEDVHRAEKGADEEDEDEGDEGWRHGAESSRKIGAGPLAFEIGDLRLTPRVLSSTSPTGFAPRPVWGPRCRRLGSQVDATRMKKYSATLWGERDTSKLGRSIDMPQIAWPVFHLLATIYIERGETSEFGGIICVVGTRGIWRNR